MIKLNNGSKRSAVSIFFAIFLISAILMSGFFVAKPVSAAHTATVSVNKTLVGKNSTGTYDFTITNNGPDSVIAIYIDVPSGFSIASSISCLNSWAVAQVGGQVQCIWGPGKTKLGSGQTGNISFQTTSPAPGADTSYSWVTTVWDLNDVSSTPTAPITLVDVAPPTIGSAVTLDVDGNGKIDRVVVTFSENIDDSTFSAGNFSISGTPASSITTGTDDDNQTTLDFSTQIDGTGVKTLLYTQGTGADLVGNLLADASSIASTDQAAPVLLSAKTTATNKIEVTFSEDLNGSTVTNNDFAVEGYILTTPNAPELNGVVTLTTSSNFGTGDRPVVSYNTTVSNGVKDLHENQAIAVSLITPSDGVAPVISSSRTLTTTTVQVTFSEPMSAVDKADFTVGGNTPSDVAFTPTETTAVLTLGTPIGTGDTPAVGTVASPTNTKDNAITPNAISGGLTSTPVDGISPTIVISSPTTSSPTKVSPIPITVTFSEIVTGFDLTDVTVTNGSKNNLGGGGAVYTFDLTPVADGEVTVKILESLASDAVGNLNSVSNTFSIVYDSVPPTVDLTKDHDDLIVRDANTVVVTATFNEPMFVSPTISINVENGIGDDISLVAMTGSGTIWTYSWGVPAGHDGLATVTVAGADLAGNAYEESDSIVFTIDNTAPTASVSTQVTTPTSDITPNVGVTVQTGENWNIKNGETVITSGIGSGIEQIITLPELLDGTYNLTLESTDVAGNATSVALNQFIIDSTNPAVVLNTPATDSVSTSADVGYTSTVTDATAVTCEYKIDGGIYASTNCASGTIAGLADGRHMLYIKATDAALNFNEANVSFVVNLNANLSVGGAGSDFSSIQEAVTKATAGDTISISAGTYAEDVVIDKTLVLTGTGSPTATSFTLNNGASVAGSSGITADVVTVNEGAKIQDGILLAAAGGIVNVGAGTFTESIAVSKTVSIIGSGSTSIIQPAQNSDGITITANNVLIKDLKIITSNSAPAVGDPGYDAAPANIAINVSGASNVEINHNSIETTGNKAMGIWVCGTGCVASNNLKIKKNTITISGSATGIYAEKTASVPTGWIIGGSAEDGNTITMASTNVIELYDVSASEVSYNTLTITTAADASNVMWFAELSNLTNLVFRGNIISGSTGSEVAIGTGFQNVTSSNTVIGVTVSDNTFSNWGSRALRLGKVNGTGTVTDVTVSTNKFMSAGEALNNFDASEVDAEANYWGNSTGPAEGAIVGSVDYRPWYTNAELTGLDEIAPTVEISSSVGAKTNVSPVTVSITFSESVVGFTADDITVTNGTKGVLSGAGASYSIGVTPNPNSTFTVNVGAGTAQDLSGNYNTVSNTLSIDYDSTLPTLSAVSIASNNANNALAKVGDVITLSFTSSEAIQTPNVTIAGNSGSELISLSNVGNAWTATYTMREMDTEGAVAFTIVFLDLAGNSGTSVTTVTDASSVTFDKTLPVIAISSPATSTKVNGAVKPVFTDSETAPAECSINNSVWVNCTSDITTLSSITGFSALADGSFTLYIKDTDASGNVGTAQVLLDKDTTGPSIVSKTPSENAVGVSPTTNITIVFGEDVVIADGNVSITGNPAKTVTFDSATKTATINPTSDLANNTTFTITISGVTDTVGNSLADTSWMFTTSASYSITLYTGWNLISLPIVPTNKMASAVLGSLDDPAKIESVWRYDSVNNVWNVYHPDNTETSDLSSMTAGDGYWVDYRDTVSGTIAGTGNLFQEGNNVPPQKTLAAGWNLIGYYQLENTTNVAASKALSTISGQWTQLRSYNNSTKQFQSVIATDEMKPGEGYWIFMKSSSYAPYLYGPGDAN